MADLLYEMEFEVKTSSIDKAEHRLKRFDAAMERSSGVAKELQRTISTIGTGGGRIGGSGGVVRSSSAGSGPVMGIDAETRRVFAFQRRMHGQRMREEREYIRERDRHIKNWTRDDERARRDRERGDAKAHREALKVKRDEAKANREYIRERDRHLRNWQRDERRAGLQRYGLEQRIATLRSQSSTGGSYGGLAALGGGIIGVGALAFRGLSAFGDTAVQAMGERDSAVRNYTALMGGNRGSAELEYYRAQQFARRTDFTESAVTKAQSSLIAQGLRGDELYRTLFAASDLSSLSGDDKSEALKGVVRALGQIKAKGRLQSEEINQISEHAPLSREKWMEEIRIGLGLKDRRAVEKAMQKGEVSADVGLSAFQRATLSQLGTNKLGQFSTQSAGSLTSLISNLEEAQSMLAKSFNSETLPAVERFKASLTDLGSQFDVSTKQGKDLAFVYKDMANTAIEAKTQWAAFKAGFLGTFSEAYRRNKESGPAVDLALQAARQKDVSEQFGKNVGAVVGEAGVRSPTEALSSIQRDINSVATAWRNWRSGKASFFGADQRAEMLTSAEAAPETYQSRFYKPLTSEPYGPPTSAKATAVDIVGMLRSRRARVAVSGAASAGSAGGSPGASGGASGGGDDHSVRIGTQVTIQGGLTVQVTVPAQPGMTPQAMSTMIGESVREALVREVGRGARRPRV